MPTMNRNRILALLISSLSLPMITEAQTLTFENRSIEKLPVDDLRSNSMDVVSGDLDNDGDLDLVIASEFRQNLILLNDGKGVFTNAKGRLPAKNHDSEDIAVADFDGDLDLDIIFVSEDDEINEYYINDGKGMLTDKSDQIPVKGISNGVAAGDLDHDGDMDVIIGNEGQDIFLTNDGKGNFVNETLTRMPMDMTVTQDVKIVDLDADGDSDLVLGNEDGNRIYINNGKGIFSNETAVRLPQAEGGEETRKVVVSDIDNDGDADLLFCNVNFKGVNSIRNRILVNDGKGVFTDETVTRYKGNNGLHSADALFTDLDNDKDADLIVANVFGGFPQTFLNDGSGIFTEAVKIIPPNTTTDAIAIHGADFDKDGVIDLYLGIFRGTDLLLKGENSNVKK